MLKKKRRSNSWEIVETKLYLLLREREITHRQLFEAINERFPDQTISLDAVNRYVAGKRKNVELNTIKRICVVLEVTPNDVIDYEEYFQLETV